jgi:predicted kinase
MYTELIRWFSQNFPELKEQMNACDHALNGHSKWHQEGSVWTHTMLVLKTMELSNIPEEDRYFYALLALLHDVGKPLAREYLPDKDRYIFAGHSGISFYIAIDVLEALRSTSFPVVNEELLLKAINHHDIFMHKITANKLHEYKYDKDLFEVLNTFAKYDSLGTFRDDVEDVKINVQEILFEEYNDAPDASVCALYLVGVPNSGKSTYLANTDLEVVSRDDILMQYAKNLYGDYDYNKLWTYLTQEDQKKIDELLQKDFKSKLQSIGNVAIDMTNTSAKSRRRFQCKNKKAIVFKTGYNELMRRNQGRSGKILKDSIIINFMKSFEYPLKYEMPAQLV